jgi:glycosyltransferase involved in cell wall biosynthesis
VNQIQEKITQEDLMVSIIIRNRNEEQYIGFAIQSVLDHFKNPEVIVIDNNSTDSSLEVVSMFRPILKKNLKIINIDNYSPGASLNKGIEHCTYDTILILSAHAQITTLNIEMLNQWFRKDYVAVFGNQTPIYKGKKISKRYIWSHFTNDITENLYSKIEDRYFLHNAFCFYKREFLIENPFDETLQGKEDRYWAIDIVNKNYKYLYDGNYQKCNHFYTSNGATWKGIG